MVPSSLSVVARRLVGGVSGAVGVNHHGYTNKQTDRQHPLFPDSVYSRGLG